MGASAADSVAASILAAAGRFCTTQGTPATSKRLLFEFLAYPAASGRTLSGRFTSAADAKAAAAAPLDLQGVTLRFVGLHIIKHYFKMRQYHEATAVVAAFLRFLRSEGALPASYNAQLEAAIKVAEAGCEELPHAMRVMRQPDARNEAYSYRYPLRLYPTCVVPVHCDVRESGSRAWPAAQEQKHKSWVSWASERCRIEPEEMEEVLQQVPTGLSIDTKLTGCWEVLEVRPDNTIVFGDLYGGSKQALAVPFTAKRAADFRRGFVVAATFVRLSNGDLFMTDVGYCFPSFYAPSITAADFGPFDEVELVFDPEAAAAQAASGTAAE